MYDLKSEINRFMNYLIEATCTCILHVFTRQCVFTLLFHLFLCFHKLTLMCGAALVSAPYACIVSTFLHTSLDLFVNYSLVGNYGTRM